MMFLLSLPYLYYNKGKLKKSIQIFEVDTDYVLEDLLSGSGPQLLANDIKAELCETRESLLMELDKRKQAEDLLNYMQSQWRRIREQLAIVGLNLPEDPALADDEAEELCGQIHVVRFVSNSIGRGISKAEVEAEMETQIESKNFEISRLMDRLRYYEAVNREMTQRNQENVAFVLLHTVPVVYEKYEDQVDSFAEKAMVEIKKQYAVFDAKVLSKIPRGPLQRKQI